MQRISESPRRSQLRLCAMGVNELVLISGGELLISVSGSTKMGLSSPNLSGTWEAFLSGPVLLVFTSQRDNLSGEEQIGPYQNIYILKLITTIWVSGLWKIIDAFAGEEDYPTRIIS